MQRGGAEYESSSSEPSSRRNSDDDDEDYGDENGDEYPLGIQVGR